MKAERYFHYEMTVNPDGEMWFEITTHDPKTAELLRIYCDALTRQEIDNIAKEFKEKT